MKRKILLAAIVSLIFVIAIISFRSKQSNTAREIVTTLESAHFEVTVVNSGELEAKNSIPIMGPEGLVSARLWTVKIEDIVEEGTIVEKGDYVATLDRTEIGERIRNEELDGEESLNSFEQTKIDTALDLRARRDELKKMQLTIERKRLQLKNSQYEPPATIEQAKLDLKEAEMDYQLTLEDYNLREEKAIARMRRREIDLLDDQGDLRLLNRLNEQFIIRAPERGMVIYRNDRGNKIRKGSNISARNPVVATLPDLTRMISRCYVNEVDIRLIRIGQDVRIGIDAFPDKRLTGKVTKIANVGEALPFSDAKVFAIEVDINESDMDLKPGMTTSNEIIVETKESAISLPLESLHSSGDSITFVYLKEGLQTIKKEVEVGISNSNRIVVDRGLNEGDQVLLNIPPNSEKLTLQHLN